MEPQYIEILNSAIKIYGEANQLDMVTEECAELIQAINKVKRAQSRIIRQGMINALLVEVADVEIMIEQIKIMFSGYEAVESAKKEKLDRLAHRVKVELYK
jgi:NTP pyrophosphatase (non-canonical NTP hydrolase)